MARRANQAATKSEPPTRVLLVRHGQTDSTGTVLPGRTAGLNLSDAGRAQAERTAELIADGTSVDAVYTSSLERARQTAAPIAAATGRRAEGRPRAHRVRLRRLDRPTALRPDEDAGVVHCAAITVVVPVSRRRELCRDAAAHRLDDRPAAGRPSRRDDRLRFARRPDQSRHRPRRSAPTSTSSSASSSVPPRSVCSRSSRAARSFSLSTRRAAR